MDESLVLAEFGLGERCSSSSYHTIQHFLSKCRIVLVQVSVRKRGSLDKMIKTFVSQM